MAERHNLAGGNKATTGPASSLTRVNPATAPSTSSGPAPSRAPIPPAWSEDNPVLAPDILPTWLDSGWAQLEPTGEIRAINDSLAQWFERDRNELIGSSFWELLPQRCAIQSAELDTLRNAQETFHELTLRASERSGAGGSPIRLEAAFHPAVVHVRLFSALPELAELEEGGREYPQSEPVQRQLFARLARAEAQLKLLSEQGPGVIFSQRADFSFRFTSPRIEELTGVSSAEWQRQPHLFWQIVHEGDADELKQQYTTARTPREPITATYRIRNVRNGRIVYVMEHRRLNLSPGGLVLGYEGVWLDVTRQTLAERRLSSAAWKETLSVLTMGLAHDFGNVMAGIHALAESFLDQIGPGHEFVDGLNLVKQNSRQASQLVHRIINLHQGQIGERNYHNLNEVISEMSDLIRKIIPRRMRFSLHLCPQSLPVYVDAVELRQVLINLVLNAVDATSPDGELTFESHALTELPRLGLTAGTVPRLPAVSLTIRDSGAGIAPENLPRVFEPFFTTKPSHKGSGLGLYNTRVFVERHAGVVAVESVLGGGAAFHLILPEADFSEANGDAGKTAKQKPAAEPARSPL